MVQDLTSRAGTSQEGVRSAEDVAKSRIIMAVRPQAVSPIMENGFLNLFQTHTSSGTPNEVKRMWAENNGAEIPEIGPEPVSLRPKYAYYDYFGAMDIIFTAQYGDVFFEFKNEVQSRSTYSVSDSLDHGSMTSLFQDRGDMNDPRGGHGKYYETQIWGPLTVNDVAMIYIPTDMDPAHRQKSFNNGKAKGLSCFNL